MGGASQAVRDLMPDHFQPVSWSGFGNEMTRKLRILRVEKHAPFSRQAAVKHQMPGWK